MDGATTAASSPVGQPAPSVPGATPTTIQVAEAVVQAVAAAVRAVAADGRSTGRAAPGSATAARVGADAGEAGSRVAGGFSPRPAALAEAAPTSGGTSGGFGSGLAGGASSRTDAPAAGRAAPALAPTGFSLPTDGGVRIDGDVAATLAALTGESAEAASPELTGINGAGAPGASLATAAVDSVEGAPSAAPIVSQLLQGAEAAGRRPGQTVQMVLQPEGLGTVSLRVAIDGTGVGVEIGVDNAAARELIQASWTQLQQALGERGLTVQSLFLDLAAGQNGQFPRADGTAFGQSFGGPSTGGFAGPFQQATGQGMGNQGMGGQGAGGQHDRPSPDQGRAGEPASTDEPRQASAGGAPQRVDYRI